MLGATTFSIESLRIMGLFATLSITTLSIPVISAVMLSVVILNVAFLCYVECRYAKGCGAACQPVCVSNLSILLSILLLLIQAKSMFICQNIVA